MLPRPPPVARQRPDHASLLSRRRAESLSRSLGCAGRPLQGPRTDADGVTRPRVERLEGSSSGRLGTSVRSRGSRRVAGAWRGRRAGSRSHVAEPGRAGLVDRHALHEAPRRVPRRTVDGQAGARRSRGLAPGAPPLDEVEIGHAADGAPVPQVRGEALGRRISLSDRAGWAVCVVSPDHVEVGCDLELVEPRSWAFVARLLHPGGAGRSPRHDQRGRLAAGDEPDLVGQGERALKVLRTGLRRDTRSVEVTLGEGDGRSWTPLVVRSVEGGTFPGVVAPLRRLRLHGGRGRAARCTRGPGGTARTGLGRPAPLVDRRPCR